MATLRNFFGILALLWCCGVFAQVIPGYVAEVRVNTAEELGGILARIESLQRDDKLAKTAPLMFVLHGEEARSFLKSSYSRHQSLVDQSARLSELGVVEIEICETWLNSNGFDASDLQPFVTPIPYGPARINELMRRQNYSYF